MLINIKINQKRGTVLFVVLSSIVCLASVAGISRLVVSQFHMTSYREQKTRAEFIADSATAIAAAEFEAAFMRNESYNLYDPEIVGNDMVARYGYTRLESSSNTLTREIGGVFTAANPTVEIDISDLNELSIRAQASVGTASEQVGLKLTLGYDGGLITNAAGNELVDSWRYDALSLETADVLGQQFIDINEIEVYADLVSTLGTMEWDTLLSMVEADTAEVLAEQATGNGRGGRGANDQADNDSDTDTGAVPIESITPFLTIPDLANILNMEIPDGPIDPDLSAEEKQTLMGNFNELLALRGALLRGGHLSTREKWDVNLVFNEDAPERSQFYGPIVSNSSISINGSNYGSRRFERKQEILGRDTSLDKQDLFYTPEKLHGASLFELERFRALAENMGTLYDTREDESGVTTTGWERFQEAMAEANADGRSLEGIIYVVIEDGSAIPRDLQIHSSISADNLQPINIVGSLIIDFINPGSAFSQFYYGNPININPAQVELSALDNLDPGEAPSGYDPETMYSVGLAPWDAVMSGDSPYDTFSVDMDLPAFVSTAPRNMFQCDVNISGLIYTTGRLQMGASHQGPSYQYVNGAIRAYNETRVGIANNNDDSLCYMIYDPTTVDNLPGYAGSQGAGKALKVAYRTYGN